MKRSRRFTPFSKILVPVIHGCDPTAALNAARLMIGEGKILLVGLVRVQKSKSLSTASQTARQIRQSFRALSERERFQSISPIHVSYDPWRELVDMIEQENPDLLLLDWPRGLKALGVSVETVLTHPPCDTALVRGPLPGSPSHLLVPARGGPYAELALRVSLAISRASNARMTSLHLLPVDFVRNDQRDAAFLGLARVLARLPVDRRQITTSDPAGTILQESVHSDLIVMGSTVRPKESYASLGPVAEEVFRKSSVPVIAVKSQRLDETSIQDPSPTAISVLVDKWFAENTFHANEFKNLERLLSLKKEQRLTISVAMPTLNEQATVGQVIRTIKRALMERIPLVDEIVLIDSQSTDRTREISEACEIPIFVHQEILPQYEARSGKGEALWKSLYVTRGDLIVWIDTDITNIHPRFVYGLLGVLLHSPRIQFVKGFYRRPLRVSEKIQAGGGGRVTELTARPLLNLFYPELSGIIQPLSGEYAGRRSLLERLTFYSGYGVEVGLLIDAFEKAGLDAIAQVDLVERIHRNQSLEPLSKMSFAIIQTVISKLEKRLGHSLLEDINKSMKLIRYERPRYFLDVEKIAERVRPPMIELPEYQRIHH
ncbi:glucosyl-3-phosphoglycerate synthase [bacterium]|nr:glucosyl-3-phosphoglycerate synthase [bacterium]MCI0605449.1 glucosyl-3-phosphoglycerate synthase [bacterium]